MKVFVVALLIVSGLFGGFGQANAASSVMVVDVREQVVTVSQPVERIVCISSALNELLTVLGAGDRIVGRDRASDFPAILEPLPIVAENSFRPQIEAILELQPDLVIADTMLSADNRAKLESFGIPVVVERGSDPERLFDAIRNLGLVVGRTERAEDIIAFIGEYESLIMERVATLDESEKPRVFWEWNEPFKTGSKTSTPDPRISLAGGINIAHDATGDYPVVSGEFVWERDPEVIIKMSNRADTQEMIVERYEELVGRVGISETSAAQDERVHVISWTVHNGVRSIIGSLHYAKWFHPELFADVEPEEIHAELLSQFYDLDLATLEPTIYPR